MQSRLNAVQYRLWTGEFLSAYVTTMRPYLLFVSGITGLVGLSFVPGIDMFKASLVFAACFLSYGFGQALTDCFQIDTDSLSAPYRPLTQGIISQMQVLVISVLGLISCTSIFALYNPVNLALGLIGGLGLATYTPFKRKWWAGPFYNSWIVVVLCLMAFMTGNEKLSSALSPSIVPVVITVFFGYGNFVLAGYFKDISADRKTGYNTLPVVFGRKVSAFVSDMFAALTIMPAAVFAVRMLGESAKLLPAAVALAFEAAGILAAVVAQLRLHRTRTDEEAHAAIAPVVHSYLLTLSSIVCFEKPEWTAFLVIFYAAFVLVLKVRPAKNQI